MSSNLSGVVKALRSPTENILMSIPASTSSATQSRRQVPVITTAETSHNYSPEYVKEHYLRIVPYLKKIFSEEGFKTLKTLATSVTILSQAWRDCRWGAICQRLEIAGTSFRDPEFALKFVHVSIVCSLFNPTIAALVKDLSRLHWKICIFERHIKWSTDERSLTLRPETIPSECVDPKFLQELFSRVEMVSLTLLRGGSPSSEMCHFDRFAVPSLTIWQPLPPSNTIAESLLKYTTFCMAPLLQNRSLSIAKIRALVFQSFLTDCETWKFFHSCVRISSVNMLSAPCEINNMVYFHPEISGEHSLFDYAITRGFKLDRSPPVPFINELPHFISFARNETESKILLKACLKRDRLFQSISAIFKNKIPGIIAFIVDDFLFSDCLETAVKETPSRKSPSREFQTRVLMDECSIAIDQQKMERS